ncbi:MAG: hypothetical protein OXC30_05520 [Alphaproteobacteria bacterium]|nr:hypothetical protein [Alphaproteobacteria bacterium]
MEHLNFEDLPALIGFAQSGRSYASLIQRSNPGPVCTEEGAKHTVDQKVRAML